MARRTLAAGLRSGGPSPNLSGFQSNPFDYPPAQYAENHRPSAGRTAQIRSRSGRTECRTNHASHSYPPLSAGLVDLPKRIFFRAGSCRRQNGRNAARPAGLCCAGFMRCPGRQNPPDGNDDEKPGPHYRRRRRQPAAPKSRRKLPSAGNHLRPVRSVGADQTGPRRQKQSSGRSA